MDCTVSINEYLPSRAHLRVAMVTETYPPEVNGVSTTVRRFVEGLRSRGHTIQLVRPRQGDSDRPADGPRYEEMLRTGIPIPRYQQLRMGMPAKAALVRAWTLKRPNVVHIATEGPLGWSALAAARKLRLPVASDYRTNFDAYSRHYGVGFLAKAVTAYLRRFHNRTDCTMVPTAELAMTLAQQGFQRLRVVGRGIDTTAFNPAHRSVELRRSWGAGEDTLVALCVSRLAPEKNLPLVIEAYRAMKALRPRTHLVLVGDGPMAAELARMGEDFTIAGRRTGADLAAHYASADAFLFASTTETFGNVTLEAMASGLAVVAYDYAAARQHLVHGRSALLAKPGDASAFIAQASRLAIDPQRVPAMGREARRAGERISWEAVVTQFEAVLLEAEARAGLASVVAAGSPA